MWEKFLGVGGIQGGLAKSFFPRSICTFAHTPGVKLFSHLCLIWKTFLGLEGKQEERRLFFAMRCYIYRCIEKVGDEKEEGRSSGIVKSSRPTWRVG